MLLLLTSMVWEQPRTAAGLRNYWRGKWHVAKQMSYERGGVSGTFTGRAEFSSIDDSWLSYVESGVALLGSDSYEASRSLLYQCGYTGPVQCYFDDSPKLRTAEDRIGAARFFHDIRLEGVEAFEHPCGPDVYRGRLIFESVDAFRFDWHVTGPRKQGVIMNCFRREPELKQ